MLNISGINKFYFLCTLYDIRCNYHRIKFTQEA